MGSGGLTSIPHSCSIGGEITSLSSGKSRPVVVNYKPATDFNEFPFRMDDLSEHLVSVKWMIVPEFKELGRFHRGVLDRVDGLQPFEGRQFQPVASGWTHPLSPFTLRAPPPDVAMPMGQAGLYGMVHVPKVMEKPAFQPRSTALNRDAMGLQSLPGGRVITQLNLLVQLVHFLLQIVLDIGPFPIAPFFGWPRTQIKLASQFKMPLLSRLLIEGNQIKFSKGPF